MNVDPHLYEEAYEMAAEEIADLESISIEWARRRLEDYILGDPDYLSPFYEELTTI